MKFKKCRHPYFIAKYVKHNTFSEVQLGIPIGSKYLMNPENAYGYNYDLDCIGYRCIKYTSYLQYKDCFEIVAWSDGHGNKISYRDALINIIMVKRQELSGLYHQLSLMPEGVVLKWKSTVKLKDILESHENVNATKASMIERMSTCDAITSLIPRLKKVRTESGLTKFLESMYDFCDANNIWVS
jgi:hypothetical protein